MHRWALALAALSLVVGCGGDNASNDGGADATIDSTTIDSGGGDVASDSPVDAGSDAAVCDGGGSCSKLGAACKGACDCCSGNCSGGVCNWPSCTSDNQACTTDAQCCSGACGGTKTCTPLSSTCKTLGNACSQSSDCCSLLCQNNRCSIPSFCGQPGDVCATGTDCCSGTCNLVNATLGTCAAPTAGPSCNAVEGMLCGGASSDAGATDGGIPSCAGNCCSRVCAPYGPTGVPICQPPSGCHVAGDLCTKDTDCCGSAGMPGSAAQPVTCNITPPSTVGVCKTMACKPDGDLCALKNAPACGANCDCCSGNCGNVDTCHLDLLGAPRCSPTQCVGTGQACASSASCCNAAPCVPNPNLTPPYVCASACGTTGATCSTDADCCVGQACVVSLGSASGKCAANDGGACALLGQECSATDGGATCCGGTPCTDVASNASCTSQSAKCTCHYAY